MNSATMIIECKSRLVLIRKMSKRMSSYYPPIRRSYESESSW